MSKCFVFYAKCHCAYVVAPIMKPFYSFFQIQLFEKNLFVSWKWIFLVEKKFVNVGDEVWTNVGLMFNVFIVIVLCQMTESQNFEFQYSKFFNDCHNSATCLRSKVIFQLLQKNTFIYSNCNIFEVEISVLEMWQILQISSIAVSRFRQLFK